MDTTYLLWNEVKECFLLPDFMISEYCMHLICNSVVTVSNCNVIAYSSVKFIESLTKHRVEQEIG